MSLSLLAECAVLTTAGHEVVLNDEKQSGERQKTSRNTVSSACASGKELTSG